MDFDEGLGESGGGRKTKVNERLSDPSSLIDNAGLSIDTESVITGSVLNDGNSDNYLNDFRS
jgi:hypothetical protein